jgi:NAD(P)-dependent dehydrogenase (short-subunit alcohol dehydrogenase family)
LTAGEPAGLGPERTIYLQADYTELAQVRQLAAEVHELTDHLDLLINNAGRAGPVSRTVSRDGNEVTLQTNYRQRSRSPRACWT